MEETEMRLCFGIFAKVLCCYLKKDMQQAALVARIARCVDRQSNYIVTDDRYKAKDDWEVKGDKSAISKLLHCTRNFVIDDNSTTNRCALEDAVRNFETYVAPFVVENKKPAVILTLLNIIRRDKSIDFEMKESFQEYFGADKQQVLHRSKFIFSDFLGRTLLYTIYGNTDNTVGREHVNLITKDYIILTSNKICQFYLYFSSYECYN